MLLMNEGIERQNIEPNPFIRSLLLSYFAFPCVPAMLPLRTLRCVPAMEAEAETL
jgi:hypothetical protein